MTQNIKFNVQRIIIDNNHELLPADAHPFTWTQIKCDNGWCCDCNVYNFEKAIDLDELNDEQIEDLAVNLFLDEMKKDYPDLKFKMFEIKFEYVDVNKQLMKAYAEYANFNPWY